MKNSSSIGRIALLTLALGTASVTATFAQTDSTTPPAPTPDQPHGGGGRGGWGGNILTDAEKAQLKKAHDAALAADPTLQTEADKLKAERTDGTTDKKTLMADMKAYQEKLKAAELKIDPTLQPIFDKLAKARANFGGKHGGGGDSGSTPPPAPAGA